MRAEPELIGAEQAAWLARLRDEFEDIRATVDYYMRTQQHDAVAHLLWSLSWYLWVSGRLVEMRGWLATLAQSNDLQSEEARYIVKSYASRRPAS